MMTDKKIAGIDFGDARVGIALSDPGCKIAFPKDVIKVKGIEDAANKTAEKIKELGADRAVIGLPKNMDGSEGYRVERTKHFAELLSSLTDCELLFFDERLSTVLAHGYLSESGIDSRKHRKVVDALSAQIILQDYLDSIKNANNLTT